MRDPWSMSVWVFIIACLVAAAVVERLWKRWEPKTRSWNIRIGVSPKPGENQVRFMVREILFALLGFAIFVVPPLLVSAPPDEGTSFRGDESILDMTVWIVFMPLAAMALVLATARVLKTIAVAPFVYHRSFDQLSGSFVKRL